ncbi:hypothetical protein Lesp01_86530 [Lentzea sp. NBRC 102530]|nr:hypothetical protein Lesp01_86530 [Lentzea sp. NBRC 102530]
MEEPLMSAPTIDTVADSDFDLDLRITTTATPGVASACDTSDGCDPTCASSCISAV